MSQAAGRRLAAVAASAVAILGAAVAVAGAAAAGRAGPIGEQRMLVLPVTWGPTPWSLEEIRREAIELPSDWVRRSSYGRGWLAGSVAPWLEIAWRADNCDAVRLARAARAAAEKHGVELRGYQRFAYVHPRGACPWSGFGGGDEIWLNGTLRAKVVVHELGHTWGLDHANALECAGADCHGVEYGDPYSPMGRGNGDFTAFEKFRLGWITDVAQARPGERAAVDLGTLERPSVLPYAFVARSAAGEFWFEYREDAGAVVVHANATPAGRPMAGQPNLLVTNTATGKPELRVGDRFTAAGAFAVAVTSSSRDSARLDFEWTDREAPKAPTVTARAQAGRVVVRWRGRDERGSGLDRFEVSVGAVRRDVRPDPLGSEQRAVFSVRPGRHAAVVTAVDRAGNRSSARRTVTVKGQATSGPRRLKVDVGGYRLYVECRGSGTPTVVFDAGLNETGGSWTTIHATVARQTRACTYDRAGLGASDPRPGNAPATNARIADELHTALNRGRIPGPYVLAGHSLGGVDIRLFAARHAADAAGLVFVDTPDVDVLSSRGVLMDGPEPIDVRPAAADLRDVLLGATPAIVLFANGPLELAARLAAHSTNSSLVFVPRTGHHIHQERPRVVTEAIRQVVVAARTETPLPPCGETSLPRLGGACLEVPRAR